MKYKYMFPYNSIEIGEKVVIVGGGVVGHDLINQIINNKYCQIVGIIDKNCAGGKMGEIKIESYGSLENMDYDHIVVATLPRHWPSIITDLTNKNVPISKCVMENYAYAQVPESSVISSVIKRVFQDLQMEKIRYMDVGACHPHLGSNTMPFYENGSRGINIEPQAELKKEFEIFRPEDINLCVGIGTAPGYATFYEATNPYLSTISMYAKKNSEEKHGAFYSGEKTIEITTLNQIVDTYCDGEFPELLDIDIEGMDEEVLKTVDFSKSSPLVICAECSVMSTNKILIDKQCKEGGYLPYCKVECNVIYLRKDIYKRVLCI